MNVRLRNDVGLIKECKIGFSWTTFFFGFFVPLFRGDFKYCLIMIIVAFLTSGLCWFVFPFFYNKWYIKDLLSKGFYPATKDDYVILVSKGFLVMPTESMENRNYNTNDANVKEEKINVEIKEEAEEIKTNVENDTISDVNNSDCINSEVEENTAEIDNEEKEL